MVGVCQAVIVMIVTVLLWCKVTLVYQIPTLPVREWGKPNLSPQIQNEYTFYTSSTQF